MTIMENIKRINEKRNKTNERTKYEGGNAIKLQQE